MPVQLDLALVKQGASGRTGALEDAMAPETRGGGRDLRPGGRRGDLPA